MLAVVIIIVTDIGGCDDNCDRWGWVVVVIMVTDGGGCDDNGDILPDFQSTFTS